MKYYVLVFCVYNVRQVDIFIIYFFILFSLVVMLYIFDILRMEVYSYFYL